MNAATQRRVPLPQRAQHTLDRQGFTLLEVIVSLVILAGTLLSIAAATSLLATYANTSSATAQRSTVIADETGKLSSIPWSDLPTSNSCTTVTGSVSVEKCVSVESINANKKRFTVIVSSSSQADTTIIDRGRSTANNPFNQ